MKYLLLSIIVIVLFAAFNNHKCEHIYVATVQPEVKIQEPVWSGSFTLLPKTFSWPRGLQEGSELVCVKCFNVRKQLLDYGPDPYRMNTLPSYLMGSSTNPDTCFPVAVDALNRQLFTIGRLNIDTSLISK